MPCCAGWTSMSYWSMEGGIHCSACPDSAGGKAPGFRLGRCVVRLLGSTASSGSGAGTVGRRVFRPSAVSGQGSCKDIETGWMIPVGRGAGAVPSLRTPGLRGPTGQRIGLWIPRKALKDPVDTRASKETQGRGRNRGFQGRHSRTGIQGEQRKALKDPVDRSVRALRSADAKLLRIFTSETLPPSAPSRDPTHSVLIYKI
ncbi:uncharacterized protein LOC134435089 isoform X4 [Engraulis encrasicolus]|uniref:uncharacterized protein LOC134435089 isoform X4 n=1 Tax=Engraulis encrasicolus TaxID=184585 RepID=UPI002FD04416